MTEFKRSVMVGGRELQFSTGKIAKQAKGSMVVRYGDSMVLATAQNSVADREGVDFLPLTVDYREYMYASGKIPGGYFKREGRPTDRETLTSRMIDRPIRPLFPEGYRKETQIIAMVLSHDGENDTDIMGMNAGFAALYLSAIPFHHAIAAVRMGLINGEFVVNPKKSQIPESRLNLTVAASEDAIVMVEAGAREVAEEDMLEALTRAHAACREIIAGIKAMGAEMNITKDTVVPPAHDAELEAAVRATYGSRIVEAMRISGKIASYKAMDELYAECVAAHADDDAKKKAAGHMFHEVKAAMFRDLLLGQGQRADGRAMDQVRPITCEVGVLPRSHGSALFTRGETQALVSATLGTNEDVQYIDSLDDEKKRFMLHYNFPPFSVGEVKMLRGAGRREIGHGHLAERALLALMPGEMDYPYVTRLVSDILESNGSSSMASVCGGCLALMDAGVQLPRHVAGIAMGLVKEGDRYQILSDIAGFEDHYGDMDFKVAGTEHGITAIQMDIKITGLSREIMAQALEQARRGRMHIIGIMKAALEASRASISPLAPRILSFMIPRSKIGAVIGPGGKNIRGLQEEYSVKIDIEDTGMVQVAGLDGAACEKVVALIKAQTEEAEVGKVYRGKVRRVEPYGAFIEILPGLDGLCHISDIAVFRVERTTDILDLGDETDIKVVSIDADGKVRLSRKELYPDETPPEHYGKEGGAPRPPREGGFGGGGRDRDRGRFGGGGRDRDRGGNRGGHGGGGGRDRRH